MNLEEPETVLVDLSFEADNVCIDDTPDYVGGEGFPVPRELLETLRVHQQSAYEAQKAIMRYLGERHINTEVYEIRKIHEWMKENNGYDK